MRDGEYAVNLDEYKSIGTHWLALYANGYTATNFGSFGVGLILRGIKRFIRNNNIITNILRIQALDLLILCSGESLTYFRNLFPSHHY